MQKRKRRAPKDNASTRAELLAYIASAEVQQKEGFEHGYLIVNHESSLTSVQIDSSRYGLGSEATRAGLYRSVRMPAQGQIAKRPETRNVQKCSIGHLIQADGKCGRGHSPA